MRKGVCLVLPPAWGRMDLLLELPLLLDCGLGEREDHHCHSQQHVPLVGWETNWSFVHWSHLPSAGILELLPV